MREICFCLSIIFFFLNPLLQKLVQPWSSTFFPLTLMLLGVLSLILYKKELGSRFFYFILFLTSFASLASSIAGSTLSPIDSLLTNLVFQIGIILFGCCGLYISKYALLSKQLVPLTHLCFCITILSFLVLTKDTLSLSSFLSGNVNRWTTEIATELLSEAVSPNSISVSSLAFIFMIYLFRIRNLLPKSLFFNVIYPLLSIACIYSLSSRLFLSISSVLVALQIYTYPKKKLQARLSLLVIIIILLIFLAYNSNLMSDFLLNVFRLQDSYRGVDSGYSGRSILWERFIDSQIISADLPFFFGSGLLSARKYQFSVDSAILGHFYELGFIGLIAYCLFLGYPLYAKLKLGIVAKFYNSSYLIKFSNCMVLVSIAYFIIGLFEYRGLSVANPLSSVVLIFIFTLIYDVRAVRRPINSYMHANGGIVVRHNLSGQ